MLDVQVPPADALILTESKKSIETRTVAQFDGQNTTDDRQQTHKNAEQPAVNPFASARVHLDVHGSNLSLDDGALEALFALYQDEKNALFTQWRVRRRKATNTFNIGLGQRWLISDEWRLGYNLFYDALCNNGPYHRLGLGFEAHQDYVRLAFNGYYPLSAWRDIGNNKLYALRPARGVDFMVQAYLPSAPQLGAKLSAEHYFDRKPQAYSRSSMKLGLNYTPIPLLKVGYDYRIGRGDGNKRHEFQLMLSYRFGIPMAHQLESSQVQQFNSLAGSWLDPALRSHQVVLARKDSARLSQFENIAPTLYQRLIDPNLVLSEALWQLIDNLTTDKKAKLVEYALDIITMGTWNNNAGDLVPSLMSQILPGDTSLRIVDRSGQDIAHYNPERTKKVTLQLDNMHYRAVVDGHAQETGGRGDCFYHAFLVANGEQNTPENVRALREKAAEQLLTNQNMWNFLD